MTSHRAERTASNGADAGRAVSRDGTSIAFERTGSGASVVIVSAALSDRADTRKLAGQLAERFTVISYDRRGRGESGDTPPYAVEREIEDLAAIVDVADPPVFVFGSSSGAALALRAAAAGVPMTKLAVFEPPFRVDQSTPPLPANFDTRIAELLNAGRRGDAVKLFMSKAVGVPTPVLLFMRVMPGLWKKLTAMAQTIPYDQTVMGDALAGKPLDPAQWAPSSATPTLIIDGDKSDPTFRNAAADLARIVPHAERLTLAGQNHGAVEMAPQSIAPALIDFFAK